MILEAFLLEYSHWLLVFDLFWSTESGLVGVESKWLGGLRGILGQVALAEMLPGTCPYFLEADSGFSHELSSLPTKEEQPGLLAKSKSEIFSKLRTQRRLKVMSTESKLRCEEGRGKSDVSPLFDGKR